MIRSCFLNHHFEVGFYCGSVVSLLQWSVGPHRWCCLPAPMQSPMTNRLIVRGWTNSAYCPGSDTVTVSWPNTTLRCKAAQPNQMVYDSLPMMMLMIKVFSRTCTSGPFLSLSFGDCFKEFLTSVALSPWWFRLSEANNHSSTSCLLYWINNAASESILSTKWRLILFTIHR